MVYTKTTIHLSVGELWWIFTSPLRDSVITTTIHLHFDENHVARHDKTRMTSFLLGGVYMRKLAPARVSLWDDFLISYRVYMMTGSFHILLFNSTFHVDKIHVWFKIANITHALPVPVYQQTDFTPKWVLVSRLHDTVARFRTGVKFSPRCENRGDSRRHNILWWYHVNKYSAMRGNRSGLGPGRKSPRCHVNTPLVLVCTWRHHFLKSKTRELAKLLS